MLKRFATLLTLLTALFLFKACDDAPQITKPILNEILTDPIPVTQSRYTGTLRRVGNVEKFGINAEYAVALEWNGSSLYMLADHGSYPNLGQYLFTVNRDTGAAAFVNPGAMDLGGSFRQGRGFTQVLYVEPTDLVWLPPPLDPAQGPPGYVGEMLAICPILDSIVSIDIETGFAGRINWEKGYCVLNETRDTVLEPHIIHATALTHDGIGVVMSGITDVSVNSGFRSAELFRVSGNFRCATPVNSNPLQNFGVGESHVYTLCFDGEYLYMSGADTQSFYVLNRWTGEGTFISKWAFAEMPLGYEVHEDFGVFDVKENAYGGIWITGLAFDGQNMYAVCSFTNALYIVE